MRGARPHEAVRRTFARVYHPHKSAIVALSGGADSVALTALAAHVHAEHDVPLELVHVEHGVRASALQDEAVALAIAARLEVPIHIIRLKAAARDEASLRASRYEALLTIARRVGAKVLLTGHTAYDQTETVLMALFRGSGRDGLRGMPFNREITSDITLARPLLRIDRPRLRRFCEQLGLPYALDPTNASLDYRRNAVRHALENLRPLFPGLDRAVARCAALLASEAEEPAYAAARAAMRHWLHEHDVTQDLNHERLEAVMRIVELGAGVRIALLRGEHESTQYDP